MINFFNCCHYFHRDFLIQKTLKMFIAACTPKGVHFAKLISQSD